jgi:hypothetical protein
LVSLSVSGGSRKQALVAAAPGTERERGHTYTHTQREARNTQTDRQIDRQTDRHTDRE